MGTGRAEKLFQVVVGTGDGGSGVTVEQVWTVTRCDLDEMLERRAQRASQAGPPLDAPEHLVKLPLHAV